MDQWCLHVMAALIPSPLSPLSKPNHMTVFGLIQVNPRPKENESTAGVRNSHPRHQGYWARCFELICGECLLLCMHNIGASLAAFGVVAIGIPKPLKQVSNPARSSALGISLLFYGIQFFCSAEETIVDWTYTDQLANNSRYGILHQSTLHTWLCCRS